MQSSSQPITHDLVFIGGGHSHAIALKQLGMSPLPGVRLTLITDVFHTPYSGMLPGYVAGFYDFDQCHIDLRPLTQFAGARMICDRAIGLDLTNQRVICAHRPSIAFDVLSIDIGSTPNVSTVPGARDYAIPVKPISQFLSYWDQLVMDVTQAPQHPLHLGIVGGGAGGVELALNIQARLHRMYQTTQQSPGTLEIHLFHRGQELLEERSPWVRRRLQRILAQRGIRTYLGETVVEVKSDRVVCQSGLTVPCDRLFWVTQASAAPWLREAGLATTANGFIQVNDYLQSVSHPQVFAAGDVATLVHHPRPKAGVFAVRQGKPLVENLRRALLSRPLQPFTPQKEFLILIGTGDGRAIASRGPFGMGPYSWIWQWKDYIDRQFMDQFTHLKPMAAQGEPRKKGITRTQNPEDIGKENNFLFNTESIAPSIMRCSGCGSKVGRSILERSLQRVKQDWGNLPHRDDILIGLDTPDDAAVVQVPAGQVMVQTVDYFPSLMDDPFLAGQISANHCLSDIFAMGAVPQSAMAIATLPYGLAAKTEDTLYQLLSGAIKTLHQSQAVLMGGHTLEGTELAFGLSCNGLANPGQLLCKSGMVPGQALILTKALGTGILFAADMRLQAKGHWIEAALQSMLLSNQDAATCFLHHQATACTDITGFGLLGHLIEMVLASQVAVELDLASLLVLDGAKEMAEQGILSSLYPQNLQAAQFIQNLSQISDRPLFPLLFDPQTSGGLLASLPDEQAIACLSVLQNNGYPQSRIIGRVLPQQNDRPPITIKM